MLVRYIDHDGISLLVDENGLKRQFSGHYLPDFPDEELFTASVAANLHKTLCDLIASGAGAVWGTHQCDGVSAEIVVGAASPELLAAHGDKSSVEAGVLEVTGPVAVVGWDAFTTIADYGRGALEGSLIPIETFEVPVGRYRVLVHRPFADTDGAFSQTATFVVELHPTSDDLVTPTKTPGADGWF